MRRIEILERSPFFQSPVLYMFRDTSYNLDAHRRYGGMGTLLVIKVSSESASEFEKPETFVSDLISYRANLTLYPVLRPFGWQLRDTLRILLDWIKDVIEML
ncbi:hypothetical protein L1987_82905 [Smallanthus sonchifolius]|uniref:Uncharacterized protein n=1 Tax=Smallanthus sonchifolius TaxID=185202 RepID=A0ACB8YCE5_9ASTR|nr:hypothetical protein L1987_82905 [Smallanthus sonchifolius]